MLDIGAHEGYWSKDIKSLFPSCHPFMIEGDRDKDKILRDTGFPYEIALLSDRKKKVTFHKTRAEYTTGNSIYRENTEFFQDSNLYYTETVTTTTLSDVVRRNNIADIDMIKLDVQGSEKDVLLGGLDIARGCKVIFTELSLTEYNEGSPSFVDMINFFDQIGFKMIDIVDLHYGADNTLLQIDAIFVNKHLSD